MSETIVRDFAYKPDDPRFHGLYPTAEVSVRKPKETVVTETTDDDSDSDSDDQDAGCEWTWTYQISKTKTTPEPKNGMSTHASYLILS